MAHLVENGPGVAARLSFQDNQIWVDLEGGPWCTGCRSKVMAQSEGVWSQPWDKPQNDPVPERWLSTVDAIRLGCIEPQCNDGSNAACCQKRWS